MYVNYKTIEREIKLNKYAIYFFFKAKNRSYILIKGVRILIYLDCAKYSPYKPLKWRLSNVRFYLKKKKKLIFSKI